MSPVQRSLQKMRAEGWLCGITERWNAFAHIRQDLFGFIDILCVHPSHGTVGLQVTSDAEINNHVLKIRKEPRALIWMNAGNQIVLHGWKKAGKRHEQAGKWICRVVKYPPV